MHKRIIRFFMSIALIFTVLFSIVGCKKEQSEQPQNEPTKPQEQVVEISDTVLEMIVGDVKQLTITNVPNGAQIDWITSNSNVVVVSEGTVTAIDYGTAVISVLVGEQQLFCEVVVGFDYESIPVLKLENEVQTNGQYTFRLYVQDSYTFTPVLMCEGEKLTTSFTLTTQSNCVSVNGMTIVAESETENAELLLSCTYEGKTYTLEIVVIIEAKENGV